MESLCEMKMIVSFSAFSIRFLFSLYSETGSRADEGSSRIKIVLCASLAKILEIAIFWLSPPERLVPFSSNSLVSCVSMPSGRLLSFLPKSAFLSALVTLSVSSGVAFLIKNYYAIEPAEIL